MGGCGRNKRFIMNCDGELRMRDLEEQFKNSWLDGMWKGKPQTRPGKVSLGCWRWDLLCCLSCGSVGCSISMEGCGSIPFHMQFKAVWKGQEHLTTLSGLLLHHWMGGLRSATRPQKWRPGVRLFFPVGAAKGNAQELRSALISRHCGLERVRQHQDCPWPSAAPPLGAQLVSVGGGGDVFIPTPRQLFLGRSAAPGRQRCPFIPHLLCVFRLS